MRNRSGDHRLRRSSAAFLGFLLALAFLGHDLLMTGNAHHAAAAIVHDSGHDGTEARHTDGIAADEDRSHVGTKAERDGCGYFGPAVSPSNNHGVASGRQQAILGVVPIDPASSSAPTEIAEPTAPPGIRRALLQVFRI